MRCKVCEGDTVLFDSADLTKNCNEQGGYYIAPSGVMVDYYRCTLCGFIFTNHFDNFSAEDFAKTIYNHDYIQVDPLYVEIRPNANARLLRDVIRARGRALRILDYGAGNGKLAASLMPEYDVTNYDPHNSSYDALPAGRFDLIFSSEVVEHVPFPKIVARDWQVLLKAGGVVLFSTMLQPPNIEEIKASWWYISPRNGHTSIFSRKSLKNLFAAYHLRYESLSDEWHIAYKEPISDWNISGLSDIIAALPVGFIPL